MKALISATALLSVIGVVAAAEVTFPSDYKNTCGIDQSTFNGWFASGTASRGGDVNPADSFTFPPVENTTCDFYQWGAQMFLWLTSPNSDGSFTFDGADFYDVVATSTGYEFQQSAGSTANPMQLRALKAEDIGGTGQAGGGDVLISQEDSLTYYGIHANDIYAEYLTGQKAGTFAGTAVAENFPSSQADMDLIEEYLKMTFDNPEAMTMELKTSWVDASTVSSVDDYLTITATVPTFDKVSDTQWTLSGTTDMTLAMVGMHIAAPVNGHPELVWSSFEHVDNAPNAAYYYLNSAGTATLAPFDSAGSWTFLPADAAQPASIVTVAKTDSSGNIVATGSAIEAVSVVQENPWGLAPDDSSQATANTDLVSLNATVLGMLSELKDVRANYYQIGGIWTVKGELPTGDSDPNIRGGDRLANSTMETFHQYPDENNGFQSRNCFLCHSVSSGDTDGINLSHIFSGLAPLSD